MKLKYYAIKSGYRTGIFYDTWDNVKQYVNGYPNAEFKGFSNQKDADDYMATDKKAESHNDSINNNLIEQEIENMDADEVIAFVDGSYKNNLEGKHPEKYGYGAIILTKPENQVLRNELYNSAFDPEGLELRNVAGELLATEEAIKWVKKMKKFKKMHIYYDYEGIEKWVNGDWQARNKRTEEYKDFVKRQTIEFKFTKVNSHTGIDYNEQADKLARNSLEGAAYKTHKDGSVYIKGLPNDKWEKIVENAGEQFGKDIEIKKTEKNHNKQVIFKGATNTVTVTIYYPSSAYIQGSSSKLFDKIFEFAYDELESDTDAIINLNQYHNLNISPEEVDVKYKQQLPQASIKEDDIKVINTLKNAVYNTILTGYKPDYTDLVSPIDRIMEHYLHSMFGKAEIDTEKVSHKENGDISSARTYLNYFKLVDDKFVLDPTRRELGIKGKDPIDEKLKKLNCAQKKLIEKIYNWYNSNRHEIFHWNKESEDTPFITNMTEARDKIFEGEKLIEEFYKLFV